MKEIIEIAKKAREASLSLISISSEKKNRILKDMAEALIEQTNYILKENEKDIREAEKKNKSPAFIDRLTLNQK